MVGLAAGGRPESAVVAVAAALIAVAAAPYCGPPQPLPCCWRP
ncbi:hypothetical protein L841_3320 [Mycobacterium sp. MAC_080597_8934]|nr:hypothetical protein L841_3320 [Mycobacterium sp. MAC_080597_8934]